MEGNAEELDTELTGVSSKLKYHTLISAKENDNLQPERTNDVSTKNSLCWNNMNKNYFEL